MDLLEFLTTNMAGVIRHETLNGRDQLVVPTVMIVEGVLNGSQGPKYYPADELESSEKAWNHKPVVVYHPQEGSACDPVILNTQKIGVVLNTKWDAPKLRTETWIDVLDANRVDKRIIESLEANKTIEVSTGLYTKNEKVVDGEFNGKKYDHVARNYRPDHLAILPDQIGACSISDGAGLLQLNASAIKEGKLDALTLATIMGKTGLRPMLTNNEKSHELICSDLYSKLQARWGWNVYIDAVFDSYFIYSREGKLYKLSYTSTDKETTIGSDPVEVYRSISYLTANGVAFQTVSNVKAITKEISVDKKQAIDALINNGGYEESDRAMLEGMPDTKVIAMAGKLAPVIDPTKNTQTQTQPSPFKPDPDTVQVKKSDWEKVQSFVANHEKSQNEGKAAFVELIVANEKCPMTKDYLLTQEMPMLQGIAKMLGIGEQQQPVANYFGAQGGAFVPPKAPTKPAEETDEPYVRPVMNFEKAGAK